ncbi:MAG: hypothetical protein AAB354_12315 [candidate division KSB1 bacterium]
MSNRVEIKVSTSDEAVTYVWKFDTLEIRAGEKLVWDAGEQPALVFFTGTGLFMGHEKDRVFEINAAPHAPLELTVKPQAVNPGEIRLVPYAMFYSEAERESEPQMRAKMIIKRSLA